ncbi:hypothetical protein [Streptomyces sp. NPDC017556]|uniref:hypothetical protein n=1 Tax=unclassified Streptomyces TaxID=2593676 RepID=UPI0037B54028
MFGSLQADGHLAQGTGRTGNLTVEIGVRDIAVLHAFQRLTPYNSSIPERVRATNFSQEHHSAIWTLCTSLTTASAAVGACLCRYVKAVTGAARQIKRNTRDGIFNVVYTKEAAVQLVEHLSSPGCLSLARKQTAAASLASWERPADMSVRPPGRRWKAWEDRVLPAHDDTGTAAAELGRGQASRSVRMWRPKTGKGGTPRTLRLARNSPEDG